MSTLKRSSIPGVIIPQFLRLMHGLVWDLIAFDKEQACKDHLVQDAPVLQIQLRISECAFVTGFYKRRKKTERLRVTLRTLSPRRGMRIKLGIDWPTSGGNVVLVQTLHVTYPRGSNFSEETSDLDRSI